VPVAVVLALGAALMYGLSDFLGGVFGRRASVWAIAAVGQAASAVLVGVAAVLTPGHPAPSDWAWAALAGIGGGIGTAFLYRGLAGARMGVVAPISAVGAAVLPVAVGVITGERPQLLAWAGIACAFPAMWLVSTAAPARGEGGSRRIGHGVADGLLAGLGFGLLFSALGQVPESAGLGPPAAGQAVSIVAIIGLATILGHPWLPQNRRTWGGSIVVGALAAGALVLFLFATQAGLLTVASVVTSLYPAVTVLLAATTLREPIQRNQAVGLLLAGVAITLVAAG
jgi:drug/metabolite transporter (DMT)-like permease